MHLCIYACIQLPTYLCVSIFLNLCICFLSLSIPPSFFSLPLAPSLSLFQQLYFCIHLYYPGVYDLTIVLVNQENTEKTVMIKLPKGGSMVLLRQFEYFSNRMEKDQEGFPIMTTYRHNNLASGLEVEFPSRGVVVLTTIDDEQPLVVSS